MRIFNAVPIVGTNPNILKTPPATAYWDINDQHIREGVADADVTIVGWGEHLAAMPDRCEQLRELLRDTDVYALRCNKSGHPRHPLYESADAPLMRYTWPAMRSGNLKTSQTNTSLQLALDKPIVI